MSSLVTQQNKELLWGGGAGPPTSLRPAWRPGFIVNYINPQWYISFNNVISRHSTKQRTPLGALARLPASARPGGRDVNNHRPTV